MATQLVQVWPKEYIYRDISHTAPSDLRELSVIDTAVIHHSACCWGIIVSGTLKSTLDAFSENHRDRIGSKKNAYWNYITYHDVIDYEWNIIHTSPWNELRRHAWHFPTNTSGLWWCYIWNWSSVEPSIAQYEAIGSLYKKAKELLWDIKLWQHKDFKPTDCPWVLFDMEKVFLETEEEQVWFYEWIYLEEKDWDTFKNPKLAIENFKNLTEEQRWSEIIYLIKVLMDRSENERDLLKE